MAACIFKENTERAIIAMIEDRHFFARTLLCLPSRLFSRLAKVILYSTIYGITYIKRLRAVFSIRFLLQLQLRLSVEHDIFVDIKIKTVDMFLLQ